MLKQICFLLLFNYVHCELKYSYNQSAVENGIKCLQAIIDNYFVFDPKSFMVMTKTFNLSYEADDVLRNSFESIYMSGKTAVMVIGVDDQDLFWRATGSSVIEQEDSHSNSDDLGLTINDENFIQSHISFIRLSDYYVVIVDGYRMFNSKIRQLVRVPSWNARAKMVIYITIPTKNRRRMMMYYIHILRTLWSYHVMNIVLLLHDWKDHSIINLFSWNPYDPPRRCGEKQQNPQNYTELYDQCINGSLVNNSNIFPDKVPKNLMKCPLKVLGVIWHPFLNHNQSDKYAGFERRILDLIAQRLNFTVKLDTTTGYWGDRIENGSWDGMFGNLKKGYGEIGIGGIYPDIDVHEDFDTTQSYLQDSFAWVVPRAREIPEWENLIISLQPTMWLATVVVYLSCTIIWYFLAQVVWEKGIKLKTFVPSMLDSWCINLGVSTVFRPTSDSFRIYFVFFCLYSMLWCTIYQTKLITVLTNPTYEKQMTDIDDLLNSKLKFGGNEYFRELFNNSLDEIEDHFFNNYLVLDVHEILNHLIQFRNVSILTSRLYLRYLSAKTLHYNDAHGEPLFYSLHTDVLSFPVEMVTVKGFALLEKFNNLLSRFKSTGLIQNFYKRFDSSTKRLAANLVINAGVDKEHEEESLSIIHLQGAFMVLLLGNILATIVFIIEKISFKINKNKNKQLSRSKNKMIKKKKTVNNIKGYGKRMKDRIGLEPLKEFIRLNHLHEKRKHF